ncbi:MAG TPA: 2-amino-4-hydroxy-6-hydroxymethyldihydropteridine diphosphokinase [Beijerinckiaceae bacterium]
MPDVLLGLGGNLGDPAAAIAAALERLEAGGVRITRRSHLYRTAPWGVTAQPDFLNLCAAAETALSPQALLTLIQRIEAELGREPGERWGPRVIDIDILTYGDVVVDEPDLQIPHPRMTERAFVLVPLEEIAPEAAVAGRTVREWAAMVDRSGVKRLDAPTVGRTQPKAE